MTAAVEFFVSHFPYKEIKIDIADIYEKLDKIGYLTFAAIDKDTPQTRIAYLSGAIL